MNKPMIKIFTPKGQKIILDGPKEWVLLNSRYWIISPFNYLVSYINTKQRAGFHRVLLNHPIGIVDHINRNKLDNRLENLRVVSKSENALNSNKRTNRNGASPYKGVSKAPRGGNQKLWRARITVLGKETSLGYFKTEREAAEAYRKRAEELGVPNSDQSSFYKKN